MYHKNELLQHAKSSIALQAKCILNLTSFIDDSFINVVNELQQCKGRVVVSGIGKSALIAQKIVATFNSTGTPSIFMHAADAMHGDIGIVQPNDIVIILSKSGESPEIKSLIPFIKSRGNKTVAICGNTKSYLSKNTDFVLNSYVEKEAEPNNLAPTTSTTAQLVIGDTLATCLIYINKFNAHDFANVHPGGNLGKRLYTKVSDLIAHNEKPSVQINSNIRQIILEISSKRMGATVVQNENNDVIGIITDGDIRRMLQQHKDVDPLKAIDILSPNPHTIKSSELALRALEVMQHFNISQLIVLDDNKYVGMLHLHDLIKEGLF